MDDGRNTWRAAIRLAITWSVVAAATAVVLRAVGDVSQPVIVLSVIVVGFTASLIRTGQAVRRGTGTSHAHRAVTVPVRGVHFPVS